MTARTNFFNTGLWASSDYLNRNPQSRLEQIDKLNWRIKMERIDINNLLKYLAKFVEHEMPGNFVGHENYVELLTKGYYEYQRDLADKKLPDTPAECENRECLGCDLSLDDKRERDCPYTEIGYEFQDENCPACGHEFLSDCVSLEGVDYPGGSDNIVYRYNCECGLHIEEVFERVYFQIIGD